MEISSRSSLFPSPWTILLGTLFWGLPLIALAGSQDPPASDASVSAAADSSQASPNVFFPVVGYTPDTSLLAGVTWLHFFQLDDPRGDFRQSMISPVAIVTVRKQFVLMIVSELYWDRERNHLKVTPEFMRFPDKFFGIGRDTRESDEEEFTPEQFSLDLAFDRRVFRQLSWGALYRFTDHRLKEVEPGGLLDSGTIPGTGKATLSAPGFSFIWDGRDNTWSARRGTYLQGEISFYRESMGSDFHFTEYILDLRRYIPLQEKGTLALQIMGKAQDGTPPFFVLPRLGGMEGLRGYLSGRYPDQVRLLARAEWRSRELWKGLGGVVFAGLGDVAPSVDKLTTAAHLYTVGAGLRYTINRQENVKVRMDFGIGNGDHGFYLSLGEAF